MGLVLVVVVCALVLGLVAGGSLRALGDVSVRATPLLVGAVVLQLGAVPTDGVLRGLLLALALVCALLVVVANRTLPGLLLIGAGLALNAAVIAANGAMPVSLTAAGRAGVSERSLHLDSDPGREEAGAGTRLGLLSDRVPVAFPPRREVVSPGDVLVAAGAGVFVVLGLRGRGSGAGGRTSRNRQPPG